MSTADDLFERKVDRSSGAANCWPWLGVRNHARGGYGVFHPRGQPHPLWAHRYAYALWVGPIPAGLTIDHLCRRRDCVNPAHLEAVTLAENIRRALCKPRCKRGHERTPENYRTRPGGRKECHPCALVAQRARRQRRQQEERTA